MRIQIRCAAILFVVLTLFSLTLTPVSSAEPRCVKVGPTTTQCQTNGSAQIVTSPSTRAIPFWGWPWGGPFFGFW